MNSELGRELMAAGRFIEITKELAEHLNLKDEGAIAVVESELAYRTFYKKHGMIVQVVRNILLDVTQTYIQDINA